MLVFGLFSVLDYNVFKLFDYEVYFNNFNYIELLVLLEVIITQLVINLSTLITNRNTSPCHVFIILVFGQLAYYMTFSGIYIMVIIFLIFILFLSIIFNEIIEINIFGLSYNTKKNITKRMEMEIEDSLIEVSRTDSGDITLGKDGYLIELKSNYSIN